MGKTIYAVNIRTIHPNSFRPGEWAKIQRVVWINNKACFHIEFIDGTTDTWVINDPSYAYEFRPGEERGYGWL